MTKNLRKWLSSNARCSPVVPIYNQVPESAANLLVPCHASRSSRELALASNLFACEICDRITVTLWLPVRPISLMRRNDLTRQYSSQPACARFLATPASAHIPVDFKPIPCSVGSQYADRAFSAFSLELLLSLMSGTRCPSSTEVVHVTCQIEPSRDGAMIQFTGQSLLPRRTESIADLLTA
jgi:hypothetical protein